MFRLRKLYFVFSFAIILCLVIYASKNLSGSPSLVNFVTQINQPIKTNKTTKKAIISALPIIAPIVDIPRITKVLGKSNVTKAATSIKIDIGTKGILPLGQDVRPFIANPEKYAINMARLRVRLDLFGLNSLTPLIRKNKGLDPLPPLNLKRKQVLILTYWRSGSTFVGDILNQYPGTFYHFEPLHSVSGSDIINKTMEETAITLMSDVFNCSYLHQTDYLDWVKQKDNQFLFQHNARLWSLCRIKKSMCFEPEFIAAMCNEFPFQVMKVTRISMQPIMQLLESFPELKIIYLVRDPRGILNSRLKLDWCQQTSSCINPTSLCGSMRRDMSTADIIKQKYPNRLVLLRYEDVSLDPEGKVKELFDFLQLNVDTRVLKYLNSHTHLKQNEKDGGPYSTKRDSRLAAFAWKTKLKLSQLIAIQSASACKDVIKGLGYEMFYKFTSYRLTTIVN